MKDRVVEALLRKELNRQKNTLMMIPSENYVSKDVLKALGSVLTNKYSEGYAKKRYYQGNAHIDEVELLAIQRAKELFGVPHANVQPYSGSPANAAVYFALLNPGDTLMGLSLSGGGHLTHGHPAITFSGKYFTSVQFNVQNDGYIDMDEAAKTALKYKPKIITVGTTAYPRTLDWSRWRAIADSVGAFLLADISHIAGLVVTGQHPSPAKFADVIMTTTHKTLRGPRGAMIMVTEKGIRRDPDMPNKIDRAVFPGLQGGPHNNTTAAIAVALHEAQQSSFKTYGRTIIENARTLADSLNKRDIQLVTGGTDNHLIVINLLSLGLTGNVVAEALEAVGIVTNRNSVPHDPNPPFYPSGVRIGTPALTTRGMGKPEMRRIANIIADVIIHVQNNKLPQEKDARSAYMRKFRSELKSDKYLANVKKEVAKLCKDFPIYS